MHYALSNFGVDTKLDIDIAALAISGLLLIFLGAAGFGAQGGARVLSLVVGVGLAGYAFYLNFVFTGGTYFMPIYAYVAPILVIINIFRSRNESKQAAETPPPPPPMAPPMA
jgi:hypothetical protein